MPFPYSIVPFPSDLPAVKPVEAYFYGRSIPALSPVRRVLDVFADIDVIIPEQDQLESLTRLALQAQELYFAAVLFERTHPSSITFFMHSSDFAQPRTQAAPRLHSDRRRQLRSAGSDSLPWNDRWHTQSAQEYAEPGSEQLTRLRSAPSQPTLPQLG